MPAPRGGVIHVTAHHASHFTVVGNHLAQHEKLSLLAIGLAVHIQSLPDGACVSIRSLAERFPEGEIRIAAALRELEAYGYLTRTLERLPGGRMATRTVSYNRPGAQNKPPDPDRDPDPDPDPERAPDPPPESAPVPDRAPAPESAPVSESPAPQPARPSAARRKPAPARPPFPSARLPEGPAADLLLGLRAHDPRLLLSVRDVQRLAPGVDAWFARGARPDAVRRTLTAALPDDLKHPAGLLSHRLTALLPPPLPPKPPAPDPLQTCEDCDRAFRSPQPGRCRDCHSFIQERVA
ncbi:helix-turn-helix domain-containing protein [Streptomyces sp. NPDC026092]|uniref:helix-turn-helix domain-containing protein n=1 Tax=Streptomyces sp. NPDC026092 TaxID=3154797 RepID=UPI0034057A8B